MGVGPSTVENMKPRAGSRLNDVFRNRRVFVTGHTGFKGAWLSTWLAGLGARVYGYSLEPPTQPSLFDAADVAGHVHQHMIGDIRDRNALIDAVRSASPEFVFHLAAQPLVRRSYREPVETYDVNIMGTVNLLEAVRHTDSVKVCQLITSDKCYENREWEYAYRENDPMGGHDPYSSSKGCAELVISSYARSFLNTEVLGRSDFSLTSVRAGNVIGGGDWAEDRIVPDCIRSLSAGEPVLVRNPDAVRPWQHVLEPLSGYLWLAIRQFEDPAYFTGGWNFGPRGNSCLSVGRLVDGIVAEWGEGHWIDGKGNRKFAGSEMPVQGPHEANYLKLDITKSETLLGWHPVYSIEDAVGQTIRWYREYYHADSDSSVFDCMVRQIGEYEGRARDQKLLWALPR